MDNFERAVSVILENEGGYVNHPKDPGGETNYGISKRAYPEIDIKNLTRDQAKVIYKRDYWDRCRCGEMPYPVALNVFDTAVNSGIKRAAKILQVAINLSGGKVTADGIVGNKTIAACNALDAGAVAKTFAKLRLDFFRSLATFEVFGRGWTKRVHHVAALAQQDIDEGGV